MNSQELSMGKISKFEEHRNWWQKFKSDSISISSSYAGHTTKFDPVQSLRFFELFLELSLFEFRFTVFFPRKKSSSFAEAPKEAWGGHLSG